MKYLPKYRKEKVFWETYKFMGGRISKIKIIYWTQIIFHSKAEESNKGR